MIQMIDVQYSHPAFLEPTSLKNIVKNALFPNQKTLFSHLELNVPKGEKVAILGANGAGKSTLLKIILGIVKPQMGHIVVDGVDVNRTRPGRRGIVGVVWGNRSTLWWDLTIGDGLFALSKMHGMNPMVFEKRLAFLNTSLPIENLLDQPLRSLSLGQRLLADLTAALLHSPSLLILDEACGGLDESIRRAVFTLILNECRQRCMTLLVCSHNNEEVGALATSVCYLKNGTVSELTPL